MARILVIDDSALIRDAMAACLPGFGHSVVTAPDGESGLAAAASSLVDVVLLDVEMPRMSGLSVCEAIKRDPARAHLPVLMMTGRPSPIIERRAREVGAAVLLGKPFSLERLQQELGDHLPAGCGQ